LMKSKEDKKVKTILLMRHGKSDWEEDVTDFDRPLTGRGRNDTPYMGRFLLKSGKTPHLIISSPAKRARETAELLAKSCKYKGKIEFNDSLYENSPGEIIRVIQDIDDKIDVAMVVGHNPSIEGAVKKLCFREMKSIENGIKFPTSAIVCLEVETESCSELYPGNCTMAWFVTPKLVRELF
jgi:phosphohistidine phosphatase